jgi:hypothetical protein
MFRTFMFHHFELRVSDFKFFERRYPGLLIWFPLILNHIGAITSQKASEYALLKSHVTYPDVQPVICSCLSFNLLSAIDEACVKKSLYPLGFTPQEFFGYDEFAGIAYVGKHDNGPFMVGEFFIKNTFPAIKITFVN